MKIFATKTVVPVQTRLNPESRHVLELRIAGISLRLESFLSWKPEEAFLPFVEEVSDPDYRVEFYLTESLPEFPPVVLHQDHCYRIHPDGKGGYLRSFFDRPRDDTPYAVAEHHRDNGHIRIGCLAKGVHCVSAIHNSFFHIDFESILISRQRLCLHAACVDTPLGGILFSGPSGIGKSTQAELWCDCRGARQINGDRPILSRDAGDWLAWGSPYAGSSGCHVNENCRVRAIVMLERGTSCQLRRLNPAEAFRAVWAGLTVHSWDRAFMEQAADLTMELIENVPVYRFACTPDVLAVQYLEEELGKEFAYGAEENQRPAADGIPVCQGELASNSAERNI